MKIPLQNDNIILTQIKSLQSLIKKESSHKDISIHFYFQFIHIYI